jgi:hypothetical protein
MTESSQVSEMTFDYTNCEKLTAQTPGTNPNSLTFTLMPNFSYRLRSKDAKASFNPPQYAFTNSSSGNQQAQCIIRFDVAADLPPTVFLYYKLTNFYQNHRRYVKSLDSNQLKGKFVSAKDLNNGDCKPLAVASNGRPIYPCGLVANSFFNGEYPTALDFHHLILFSRLVHGFGGPGWVLNLYFLRVWHRLARRSQEIRFDARLFLRPNRASTQLVQAIPKWL